MDAMVKPRSRCRSCLESRVRERGRTTEGAEDRERSAVFVVLPQLGVETGALGFPLRLLCFYFKFE